MSIWTLFVYSALKVVVCRPQRVIFLRWFFFFLVKEKDFFHARQLPTVTVGLMQLMNIAEASQALRFCFLVVFLVHAELPKHK